MVKKETSPKHLCREAICQYLLWFDLEQLSEQDQQEIAKALSNDGYRPFTVKDGYLVGRKVWQEQVSETLVRLGIVKPEAPDLKSAIKCEPIKLEPVAAGKGKDATRIQPPLFTEVGS